jgi:hypothetical protein
MAALRKPPFELLLKNLDWHIGQFAFAIKMRGKSPHWSDERVSDARTRLGIAGTFVRRMQLNPVERDLALVRLRKMEGEVTGLLRDHGRSTMNETWFPRLLRRVASQ